VERKNRVKKERRKMLYLPLSLFIPFCVIFSLLILTLVFLGPIIFFYLETMIFDGFISPYILIVFFLGALFLTIFLLFHMIRINERLRSKYEHEKQMMEDGGMPAAPMLGKYTDSDRSYLEQRIAELSDQLLSSQKRLEDVNHLVLSLHEKNVSSNGTISSQAFLERFNIDLNNIIIDNRLVFVLTLTFGTCEILPNELNRFNCNRLDFMLLLRTTQMQEEEVNYQHKQSPGRQKGVEGLS